MAGAKAVAVGAPAIWGGASNPVPRTRGDGGATGAEGSGTVGFGAAGAGAAGFGTAAAGGAAAGATAGLGGTASRRDCPVYSTTARIAASTATATPPISKSFFNAGTAPI